MRGYIRNQITSSCDVKQKILTDDELCDLIGEVSARAVEVYRSGHKTLFAGNGGSAADAQHLAGEFVSRFHLERPGLPSIALTTDTSILTAVGNDYGYERLFARQIEANGVAGDMFIGISTSGTSKNIVEAMEACRDKGILSVALTGESGGLLAGRCDYCIRVPSTSTPRIQESHILIGHIICSIVERELFGEKTDA